MIFDNFRLAVRKLLEVPDRGLSKNNELPIWDRDREFLKKYKEIKDKTLVSKDRCFSIFQLARYASSLASGDFAEVGVYKGGTAKLIASCRGKKTIHLFDTFKGMPEVNPGIDFHKKGEFVDCSLTNVKKFLNDCDNARFYPGFFPDTAKPVSRGKKFCFVHIDVDIYINR